MQKQDRWDLDVVVEIDMLSLLEDGFENKEEVRGQQVGLAGRRNVYLP